ncbi:MAG TPA: undecaprenyl-diphosphatase UppP [Alphaproteobacteria bacterium]|jgi:undecaprenyl-diphosphatase|nr:undecaprenyl-diphosphatase UppP [Alphaproteobacteria bacterium]
MNFLHVLILSIVEGLTEFLPISSTGHLILTTKLLNIASTNFVKTFEIVIQLGAIMAIVVLYFKKLVSNLNLLKKLFVAFLPTVVVGFTLYPLIKNFLLGSSAVTLWALFLGGIGLIIVEKILPKLHIPNSDSREPTYKQAFLIGIFQSFSVIPGVSRAAATIMGGLFSGLSRETATEFSFLLAVPTMFAATVFDIYKSRQMITPGGSLTLFVGTVLSFLFAILAVKFLVGFVKKHDFTIFGIYRIVLAILFWLFIATA